MSFALAEKLGRAEAHELVAELARQAATDKRAFKDVVAESDKVKAQLDASELARLFMPNHYQGSAQTFIDRLVASAQGRAVRRSSSVAHLTDPKMPTVRPDDLSAISSATSPVKASVPAAEASATRPALSVAAEKSAGSLGQAVAAASALIDQTISELTNPATPPVAKPADAEPKPVEPASAAASTPAPLPAPTPEPPPAQAGASEPAVAPEADPTVAADAPSIEQPDEEPGALLEVFARAAENENEQPEPA